MATIKTKAVDAITFANPKGSQEHFNTSTRYTIGYMEYRKYYYLSITPCNIIEWGYQCDCFTNNTIPLMNVTRRSAKAQRTCETFLQANAEAINTAFLANGINGAKEAVRDLWHN